MVSVTPLFGPRLYHHEPTQFRDVRWAHGGLELPNEQKGTILCLSLTILFEYERTHSQSCTRCSLPYMWRSCLKYAVMTDQPRTEPYRDRLIESNWQECQGISNYKRNPRESNLWSGTSIGGNFNGSLTLVLDSNLNCEAIASSLIPKSDRTAYISFSERYSCRAFESCWGLAT